MVSARRSAVYVIYVLGWLLATLFYFSQDLARRIYIGEPTPWQHLLISWLIGNLTCGLLAPIALWFGRRWPLTEGTWKRSLAIHLPVTLCLATMSVALEAPLLLYTGQLSGALSQRPPLQIFEAIWVYGFHGDFLAYWIVLGLQAGGTYYRALQSRKQEALQLELQLSDARLSALKMQLQPHFLFNALSAIIVLVRQHKTRPAEETLTRLSDLLRRVLSDSDAQEVTLRRELELLNLYLSIEQVRFQDRLMVDVNVTPETLEAAVPHLGLQPIVENAVRHGLGGSLESVRIELKALRRDDRLYLSVHDDGPGFPKTGEETKGIGLANTRARLKQLYGDSALLTVANGEGRGATVTIAIPFRLAAEVDRCA
jgi:two-component system LytT family sensor kinase